MNRMILYYLSGTGNTYRTAVWIKETAVKAGIDSAVIPLEKADPHREISGDDTVAGFGMPTHGFTLPWMMLKFLLCLPRGKGKNVFVWATRAGAKYGPIPGYPPGIAGSSIFIAALVLVFKGYRVKGLMSVNMPSNWMSLHSGLRKDIIETIISKARPKVTDFAEKIISGERILVSLNTVYEFTLGAALLPVSAGYILMGRFGLAKLFFACSKCSGCGLCAKHCPTGSIKMIGKKHPLPYWSYTCESCMRCMGFCPEKAVQASQPLAVILYFFTIHLPVSAYFYSLIMNYTGWRPEGVTLLSFVFYLGYCFFVFFSCYIVFWSLAGIRFFNLIFTYTTLTSIYRRYHEPGTEVRDFNNPDKIIT